MEKSLVCFNLGLYCQFCEDAIAIRRREWIAVKWGATSLGNAILLKWPLPDGVNDIVVRQFSLSVVRTSSPLHL